MLELVAERGCGYVLMHIEGPPRVDREPQGHRDPVAHLLRWLEERMQLALDRGVAEEQIALDPGLDFDLSVDDDLEILRRLGELRELGRPLFVALSRKDFLGAVLAGSWEDRAPPADREWATAAATALAVAEGAEIVRLHDRSALDALRTVAAISGRRRPRTTRPHAVKPAAGVLDLRSAPERVAAATGWERAIEPGRGDGRLVAESVEAARDAERVGIPPSLAPELAAALPASGIEALYSHQLRGARGGRRGQRDRHQRHRVGQVAVASTCRCSTSLVRDDGHRALYLYPTKALAQDQARKLSALGLPQLRHAIYDGDTPREDRPQIRRRSNLILTNPDMLHVGILPHHRSWGDFLASLGLGGRGRGPHLSRRVRLARRQRAAPSAAGRRACTGRPRGSSSPRPRSPTRWSSPSAWSASRFGWSTPMALHGPGGGSGSGTRRSSTSGR